VIPLVRSRRQSGTSATGGLRPPIRAALGAAGTSTQPHVETNSRLIRKPMGRVQLHSRHMALLRACSPTRPVFTDPSARGSATRRVSTL